MSDRPDTSLTIGCRSNCPKCGGYCWRWRKDNGCRDKPEEERTMLDREPCPYCSAGGAGGPFRTLCLYTYQLHFILRDPEYKDEDGGQADLLRDKMDDCWMACTQAQKEAARKLSAKIASQYDQMDKEKAMALKSDTLDFTQGVLRLAARESLLFSPPPFTDELVEHVQGVADEVFKTMKDQGDLPERCIGLRVEKHPSDPTKLCIVPLMRLNMVEITLRIEGP